MVYSGGCLCGALKFVSNKDPLESGYCHCSICRKSTSAPVVAFASFPVDGFAYIQGNPTIYRSSATGQREFCCRCGSQIAHREVANPQTVDVNSGVLDDVTSVPPAYHIHTQSQVSWLQIEDDLPRHKQGWRE